MIPSYKGYIQKKPPMKLVNLTGLPMPNPLPALMPLEIVIAKAALKLRVAAILAHGAGLVFSERLGGGEEASALIAHMMPDADDKDAFAVVEASAQTCVLQNTNASDQDAIDLINRLAQLSAARQITAAELAEYGR